MYIDTNNIKDKKLINYLEHIDYSINYGIFNKGKDFKFFDEDFNKLKEGLLYIFNYIDQNTIKYNDYILIKNEVMQNE